MQHLGFNPGYITLALELVPAELNSHHDQVRISKQIIHRHAEPVRERYQDIRTRHRLVKLVFAEDSIELDSGAGSFQIVVFFLQRRSILCYRNALGIPRPSSGNKLLCAFSAFKNRQVPAHPAMGAPASFTQCDTAIVGLPGKTRQAGKSHSNRHEEDCSFLIEFLFGVERSEASVDAACALESSRATGTVGAAACVTLQEPVAGCLKILQAIVGGTVKSSSEL